MGAKKRVNMVWLTPSAERLEWCRRESEAASSAETVRRAVRFLTAMVKQHGFEIVPTDDAVSVGSTAPTQIVLPERTAGFVDALSKGMACSHSELIRRAMIAFEKALLARSAKRPLELIREDGSTVLIRDDLVMI